MNTKFYLTFVGLGAIMLIISMFTLEHNVLTSKIFCCLSLTSMSLGIISVSSAIKSKDKFFRVCARNFLYSIATMISLVGFIIVWPSLLVLITFCSITAVLLLRMIIVYVSECVISPAKS